MRLVSMDVDYFGRHGRCQLGPFSKGLNAICGPQGSGKSTLLRWLRDLAETDRGGRYAGLSSDWARNHQTLAGIAEIESRGYAYNITTDRNGRIRVDRQSAAARDRYSGFAAERRVLHNGSTDVLIDWTKAQREAFAGLAAACGPHDSETALEQLASRLGIAEPLAIADDQREQLLARRREIGAKIERVETLQLQRESLQARQRTLEAELHGANAAGHSLRYEGQEIEHRRFGERVAAIEVDLQHVLQEMQRLDREIGSKQSELKLLEADPATVAVGESYRSQLQQLDDRLNRWRQTLRDLRSHRETIDHNSTDARLDKQIGDQLSTSKEADPRAALRSLEAQIASTRQQLDVLVQRYTEVPGYDYRSASAAVSGTGYRPNEVPHSHGVYRDVHGRTYVGHPTYLPESSILPDTLRSMQKDLHEVCQQLARHEAKTATDTLRQQAAKLKRCEAELLECVEELIEERAGLLRRIASEHHISIEQLTLAFGAWCQCHDHPHLQDWLLSEEGSSATKPPLGDTAARQHLLDEIQALKKSRSELSVRADELRRQLRDADIHRRGIVARKAVPEFRSVSDIQRDLQQVLSDLADLAELDRLQAEMADIDARLHRLPGQLGSANRFWDTTQRHIVGLMGAARYEATLTNADHRRPYSGNSGPLRYDLVDGVITSRNAMDIGLPGRPGRQVPSEIVRIAMRLAIAELMALRGEPISLWIDDTLDSLPSDLQHAAVSYLSNCAANQQQIFVLTAEQRVAESVQLNRGWVGYLGNATVADFRQDDPQGINQQLMALANDEEADKWYRPHLDKPNYRRPRNDYYLTERSLIEDLPSIDPDLAARCRTHGIDRIGNLLDVDPTWLADRLDVSGISERTVEAWQSVASLLCSVRNLRPFDARVLVGAGVRSPQELAAMHPSQLLDRVERFLATERGQRILRSGNSYELSRITSWIASATSGSGQRYDWDEHYEADARRAGGYGRATEHADGYRSARRKASPRSNQRSATRRRRERAYPVITHSGDRTHWKEEIDHGEDRRSPTRRGDYQTADETADKKKLEDSDLKFYLELASPVVDAPSIGPRMAERLEKHNIFTVDQLLAADPEALADRLNLRRVDAELVGDWQEQARLVCRIPNLRGHDAQLLVACGMTSPEDLASMDAETVLEQVSEVAESKEGQRILRGGQAPDLEEVSNWIAWAAQCRKLSAA